MRYSFKILLIVVIFMHPGISKRHIINKNRVSSTESSIGNSNIQTALKGKKPIIIGLKKGFNPVGEITKFLTEVKDSKFANKKQKIFGASSTKSDRGLSFLQISQTEYPQIFVTPRSKHEDKSRNNDVFYPFHNYPIVEFQESLSNPDTLNIKFLDPSNTNEFRDSKFNKEKKSFYIAPKHLQILPKHSNLDLYSDNHVLPSNDKHNIKINKSKMLNLNNKHLNSNHVGPSDEGEDPQEALFLDFIGGYKIKGIDSRANKKNEKSNIQKEEETATLYNFNEITNDNKNLNSLSYMNTPKSEQIPRSTEQKLTTIPTTTPAQTTTANVSTKNKTRAYISGVLNPDNSLNLQISLMLKINNNSFSLMPVQ